MSNLLKTKRLVDGDDEFRWRVEAAAWACEIEMSDQLVRFVASDETVLKHTDCDEFATVNSSKVEDEHIIEAIERYKEITSG